VVVPVDVLHVPAVGRVARRHVLVEGDGRGSVDRDVVVVVVDEQVAQAEMSGDGGGLGGNPFHEIAVAGQAEDALPDELVPHPCGSIFAPRAIPTAFPTPCPSGPVVASTPSV
jgi:hypothetical protein